MYASSQLIHILKNVCFGAIHHRRRIHEKDNIIGKKFSKKYPVKIQKRDFHKDRHNKKLFINEISEEQLPYSWLGKDIFRRNSGLIAGYYCCKASFQPLFTIPSFSTGSHNFSDHYLGRPLKYDLPIVIFVNFLSYQTCMLFLQLDIKQATNN